MSFSWTIWGGGGIEWENVQGQIVGDQAIIYIGGDVGGETGNTCRLLHKT